MNPIRQYIKQAMGDLAESSHKGVYGLIFCINVCIFTYLNVKETDVENC